MNFTQLTVFREVMDSGSISQTAKKLGRTQPAISLAIKNLERSLGLSLFERRGRQLVPVCAFRGDPAICSDSIRPPLPI